MVNGQVLVLNRHYQPVNVTNVRRAFIMLYLDLARAVDKDYSVFDFDAWARLAPRGETLRSVSREFRVPRVIVLQTYDRMPIGQIRFSRGNVFVRDSYTCQYCQRTLRPTDLNLDHVLPKSRGGGTSWENVVTSCIPCNLKKGRRTPEEANMRLAKKPERPRFSALVRQPFNSPRITEWQPYLGILEPARRASDE